MIWANRSAAASRGCLCVLNQSVSWQEGGAVVALRKDFWRALTRCPRTGSSRKPPQAPKGTVGLQKGQKAFWEVVTTLTGSWRSTHLPAFVSFHLPVPVRHFPDCCKGIEILIFFWGGGCFWLPVRSNLGAILVCRFVRILQGSISYNERRSFKETHKNIHVHQSLESTTHKCHWVDRWCLEDRAVSNCAQLAKKLNQRKTHTVLPLDVTASGGLGFSILAGLGKGNIKRKGSLLN